MSESQCTEQKHRQGYHPGRAIGSNRNGTGRGILTRCYFWEFEFNRELFKLDNCNHIYPKDGSTGVRRMGASADK